VKLDVPDKFAAKLERADVLVDLACGMYAAEHLTLGQAAELAEVSQGEMQRELGRRGIASHYGLTDLETDLKAVDELKGR
jgi:predicted HTH domain antitoxin